MIRNGFLTAAICLIGVATAMAQVSTTLVVDDDIQLIRLQDSIYMHVTWDYPDSYGRFSSNGLILIKNGKALMIDTPMDNAKTERLTKYLKENMSAEVTTLIVGHYHNDCMGGLEYLQSIGTESIANTRTISKCRTLGLKVPSKSFTTSLTFDFYDEPIECRYFGAGHTFDNIIIWIPNHKILFGGCLIKSLDAQNLGNLSDAVVSDWDHTIKLILNQYPGIEMVIPGHGDYGGKELLTHTIQLVHQEKNRNIQ